MPIEPWAIYCRNVAVLKADKLRDQLQATGIYRASGHEHLTGSLVIPVMENGEVKEVYGRKINRLRKGTPDHCYLPGEHQGVFNKEGLQGVEEVILCESLIDAILSFMPDEDTIKYSAMTGQSLYYLGETNIKHKILAIAEEEGATQASYALKLLQSEGEISIASTAKDPQRKGQIFALVM